MTLPKRKKVLAHVAGWGELVDQAIADGVRRHLTRIGDWDDFEWRSSLQELLELARGRDAPYDRPTAGPAYALWYHARRVNPLVALLARVVRSAHDRGHDRLDLVDLGAGTGAVAWATALVVGSMADLGGNPPRVDVHEVESSPFMSATADSLWEALAERHPHTELVQRRSLTMSWPMAKVTSDSPLWLISSYLVDHTDRERLEEMGKAVQKVVDRCNADGAIFVVASSKREIAEAAVAELENTHGWEVKLRRPALCWKGDLEATARVRRELYEAHGLGGSHLLQRRPTFHGDSLAVREARRPGGRQGVLLGTHEWVELTEEQETAVSVDPDRSVLVLGAAGSGKSIVLVERLVRLLTRSRLPRQVLVTTFNKTMLAQLSLWLRDRLDHAGIGYDHHDEHGHIVVEAIGNRGHRVELLNWDKVPTRLFGIGGGGVADEASWCRAVEPLIAELLSDRRRFGSLAAGDTVAQPRFILDEIERVIYGLAATTWEAYSTVDRSGRRVGLRRRGPSRELVWAVYERAPDLMFVERRLRMLDRVRSGQAPVTFTDVYVDEAQDFTPSDIECLHALCRHDGTAFYACDEAQAVHLGLSYQRPPPVRGRWSPAAVVQLAGSHRLPVPVARCVERLAAEVQEIRRTHGRPTDDVALPASRKAAVIGVRPILIVGEVEQLAAQIRRIARAYRDYLLAEGGDARITVCEPDPELAAAVGPDGPIGPDGPPVETTTVLKIKGLERSFVVWSARRAPFAVDEAIEVAYTVMTRTSCLLALAVDPHDLPDVHHHVLRALDSSFVMRWDRAAADWWDSNMA